MQALPVNPKPSRNINSRGLFHMGFPVTVYGNVTRMTNLGQFYHIDSNYEGKIKSSQLVFIPLS